MSLKIGEIAERGGVNLQNDPVLRAGRLAAGTPHLASGCRMFPETAVRRVRFIKRAQELEFSLAEIHELLSLCGKMRARAQSKCAKGAAAKIADIEEKIRTLRSMKNALARLTEKCPGCGPLSDCPILDALDAKGVLA